MPKPTATMVIYARDVSQSDLRSCRRICQTSLHTYDVAVNLPIVNLLDSLREIAWVRQWKEAHGQGRRAIMSKVGRPEQNKIACEHVGGMAAGRERAASGLFAAGAGRE